jgi:hypothetical protein
MQHSGPGSIKKMAIERSTAWICEKERTGNSYIGILVAGGE